MKHELFLALRYLKPRRNAVSLITLTSILGVSLGVAVLIIVMAVMTGFTGEMKNKLIETQAHFQIRNANNTGIKQAEVKSIIKKLEENDSTGAPVIQSPVLIQYGKKNQLDSQVVMFAAPPQDLKKHLHLDTYIKKGDLKLGKLDTDWRSKAHYAVISADMAKRWNLDINDRFLVHSATHLTKLVKFKAGGGVELNENASMYLPTEFTVAGIYSLGKSDFDRMVFFADLDDAADVVGLNWGEATAVFGWGPDPFDQQQLLTDLREQMPGKAVIGWEEANRNFLDVLAVEKTMMFFLLIFIVLVAAFSIANTLITSVYQKTREIGLLKALGCSDGAVMRIFILQGMLVGIIGSVSGTLLGCLVIRFRQNIINLVSRITGQNLVPKEFYFFDALPAEIVTMDVVIIVLSSIALCTIAALLPALRAARLQPAEALRYE